MFLAASLLAFSSTIFASTPEQNKTNALAQNSGIYFKYIKQDIEKSNRYIQETKQDFRTSKQDIQEPKQDIRQENPDVLQQSELSGKTERNIQILRQSIENRVFSRTDVVNYLQLSPSPASELLRKMLSAGLIEKVIRQGKGKYRFI